MAAVDMNTAVLITLMGPHLQHTSLPHEEFVEKNYDLVLHFAIKHNGKRISARYITAELSKTPLPKIASEEVGKKVAACIVHCRMRTKKATSGKKVGAQILEVGMAKRMKKATNKPMEQTQQTGAMATERGKTPTETQIEETEIEEIEEIEETQIEEPMASGTDPGACLLETLEWRTLTAVRIYANGSTQKGTLRQENAQTLITWADGSCSVSKQPWAGRPKASMPASSSSAAPAAMPEVDPDSDLA
eukprot:962203-Amphidinium_carterae.2